MRTRGALFALFALFLAFASFATAFRGNLAFWSSRAVPSGPESAPSFVWMGGSQSQSLRSHFSFHVGAGTADPSNVPGAREKAATWTDASGKFWMFGGVVDQNRGGNEGQARTDLWRFDPANSQWTFIKGDAGPLDVSGSGERGTIGVSDSQNLPSARAACATWKDASGRFLLFGGIDQSSTYNDVWRFDPASEEWTWMAGPDAIGDSGEYGTLGIANSANRPPARSGAAFWTDASGDYWLFGGRGAGSSVYFNDLWKLDKTTFEWTWMGGSSSTNQSGVFGVKGVEDASNIPSARGGSAIWKTSSGDVWIQGGKGVDAIGSGDELGDLWRLSASTQHWTWVTGSDTAYEAADYGSQGVEAASNIPGSRQNSVTWIDGSNRLWLFGSRSGSGSNTSHKNDLWRFNPTTGQWTWIAGAAAPYTEDVGTYGVQGVENSANSPGARGASAAWRDASGAFWLFGGLGLSGSYEAATLADLWRFNPTTSSWMWVTGPKTLREPGVYGTLGVAHSSNQPGARRWASTWTASGGTLWMFGGVASDSDGRMGLMNDLWSYDLATRKWTWQWGNTQAYGSTYPMEPTFGTQGVEGPSVSPGGREKSAQWIDAAGDLWLYGGESYYNFSTSTTSYTVSGASNLWRYRPSTGQWTWMSGHQATAWASAVHGVKGVSSPTNKPGHRERATTWVSPSGDLWLFGGNRPSGTPSGYLNDLWKYSPATSEWTWVAGGTLGNTYGVYGNKGEERASNAPGGREGAAGLVDAAGNLWLFGGFGRPESGFGGGLNDVWRFNIATSQWAWIAGTKLSTDAGTDGTLLLAGTSTPSGYGAYSGAVDALYRLWIIGPGAEYSYSNYGRISRFDPASHKWNRMAELSTPFSYGTIDLPSASNLPPGRTGAAFWSARPGGTSTGTMYMFGGNSKDTNDFPGVLNDMWSITQ